MADGTTPHAALADTIARRISERDRHGAIAAALDAVADGSLDVPALYAYVIAPLLIDEGERWQRGVEHVWEEHYSTAVLRTIVEALSPTVARAAAGHARNGRVAVLACPPQEPHDLGLRMLSDRFELAGWTAHFLGADVPSAEIVAAANAISPDLLVLSASTHYNRIELKDVVARIRPALPADVRVKVTGPAFRVSHEGWADDDVLDPDDLAGA